VAYLTAPPFFSFYGSKWRAAPHYPAPEYDVIIEPFAGSAGYSLRHAGRSVLLIEKDPTVAATWRYLLKVKPKEILALPDLELEQTVDDLSICEEARLLIGWWLNKGSAQPKKTMSAWMRQSKENGGNGWRSGSGGFFWGTRVRERIAKHLPALERWQVVEGDYRDAPNISATWFIDPPYQKAGKHYRFSSINYGLLGFWCRARRGQTIVCENAGANWLPFMDWKSIKANESRHGGKVSKEVIWLGPEINSP